MSSHRYNLRNRPADPNSAEHHRPKPRARNTLYSEQLPSDLAPTSAASRARNRSRPGVQPFARQQTRNTAVSSRPGPPHPSPRRARNTTQPRGKAHLSRKTQETFANTAKQAPASIRSSRKQKPPEQPKNTARAPKPITRPLNRPRKQSPHKVQPAEVNEVSSASLVNARVSAWLSTITSNPPTSPAAAVGVESFTNMSTSNMTALPNPSRSLTPATAGNAGDDNCTTEKAEPQLKPKVPKRTYKQQISLRGISTEATVDPKLNEIDVLKDVENPTQAIPWESLNPLIKHLQDFIKKSSSIPESRRKENAFEEYDAFMDVVRDWTPKSDQKTRIPPMSKQQFRMDKEFCMSTNEAVLQRTTMIAMIDRYEIRDKFSFVCEGQWDVGDSHRLKPLCADYKLALPKPDLSISFNCRAIRGNTFWIPMPTHLDRCLYPDGGDERWFPFLFVEVKRATDTLQNAILANLHSAAQALYNIYHWMSEYEDLRKQYFNDIRVFSITLNAKDLALRIHRAEPNDDKGLLYHFAEVVAIDSYNRRQACHLVNSVLNFAELCLLPPLKEAFTRVSNRERAKVEAKQRTPFGGAGRRTKRARSDQDTSSMTSPLPASAPRPPDGSQSSFNTSGLNLEDD